MRSCPDCTEQLVDAAVSCRCGWRDRSRPADPGRPLQDDFLRQQRDADARAEASAFMAKHGLKNGDDARNFIVKQARAAAREAAHMSKFELWCKGLKQHTVDYYVREAGCGGKEATKILERFRDRGVIDDANKIVPLEQREAQQQKLRSERQAVEAELEARRLAREAEESFAPEARAQ